LIANPIKWVGTCGLYIFPNLVKIASGIGRRLSLPQKTSLITSRITVKKKSRECEVKIGPPLICQRCVLTIALLNKDLNSTVTTGLVLRNILISKKEL
jgi:hypothetical protein